MRLRIALAVGGVVLASILVYAAVLIALIDAREEQFIDSILDEQINYNIDLWRRSGALVAPNTPDMRLYRVPGGPNEPVAPPQVAGLAPGNHEVFIGGREFHVAVRAIDSGRFILSYDVEEHEQRLHWFAAIVTGAAAAVSLLTLVGAYLLSGRLTRRLDTLVAAVRDPDYDRSYRQPGMDRELAAVADALDAHRLRHERQLQHERDFAANLSHELRTPLAAIRSDAEMLTSIGALPSGAARRAERITQTVDRVAMLATGLLAVARRERPGESVDIALAQAVREAWDSLTASVPEDAQRLESRVAAHTAVRGDPALVQLVLRNLLDNARRHAPNGPIVCDERDGILTIRDRGPGFAQPSPDQAFDRFHRAGAGAGHGLGLALVRDIAELCGWRVTVSNASDHGAVVSIEFGQRASHSPHTPITLR